ncbi:MAG: SRPBCC domain-containing protein [Acidimicrobiia bacterium]
MSSFERTFVVRFPVARVWRGFVDGEERRQWGPKVEIEPVVGGAVRVDYDLPGAEPVEGQVVAVEPERRFTWSEGKGMLPGATEVTVTFEQVDGGTQITISHSGFGDGDDWLGLLEAHARGWDQAIADLEFYLRTGLASQRFFTFKSDPGLVVTQTPAGLEILRVEPGRFADGAGLQVGDLLIRINGISIYTIPDLWSVNRSHNVGAKAEVVVVRDGKRVASIGTF